MHDEDQFTRADGDKTLIAGISGGALTYRPGDTIDNDYRLIKLLGRGGVGAVFSCQKISLDKIYALKLLAGAAMTGDVWTRFQTEAKLLARLNHPGIVRVYNMGIDRQQCPYYIMDLLEGQSLSALVRSQGRLKLDQALDIFMQMAEALSSAHSQGIVHRDIKPSNVMLVPNPKTGAHNAVLVDFGLARTGESDIEVQAQTATGHIFGTPAYMSPEQCQGEKVDYRSDIYSFGCSLHQALAGSPPFTASNPLQVLMMHQSKAPPNLPADENGRPYPEALQVAILKMLKKKPSERYQSMGQIIHDLERIKSGKPIMAQGLNDTLAPGEEAAKKALSASRRRRAGGEDPHAVFSQVKKVVAITVVIGAALSGFFLFKSAQNEHAQEIASHMIAKMDNIKDDVRSQTVNLAENLDTKDGQSNKEIKSNQDSDDSSNSSSKSSTADKTRDKTDNLDSTNSGASGATDEQPAGTTYGDPAHIDGNSGSNSGSNSGRDSSAGPAGKDDSSRSISKSSSAESRSSEGLFFAFDSGDVMMSNDIFPWKDLKKLGASDREVKSLPIENLMSLSEIRKKAQEKFLALQSDPRYMSQKFYSNGAFHFPKDIILGSISVDHGLPQLAMGDMPVPPGKDVFLYLTTPTKRFEKLVDKFGPTDLTGISVLYEHRDEVIYVIQKLLTWKRLKDVWFFSPYCRIIAKDTDDWGEAVLTNVDLPVINRFRGLRTVGLAYPISGPAILQQPFLRKIEGLGLKRIINIEPLIDELPRLDNIKELGLYTTETTDEQLEKLAHMKNLQKLTILRSHLTFNSLGAFEKMKELKELHIDRNDWSKEQKSTFRKSLPNCKVVFERVISSYYWPMLPDDIKRFRCPESYSEP